MMDPSERVAPLTGSPGVDVERLTSWLDAELPGLRKGPLVVQTITGGRSNLTYRVSDGVSDWALRRPPLGHVLPTAHDMRREHRVMSSLQNSRVPVPVMVALCTDDEVLGAQFYLMSFVDGVVLDKPQLAPDAEAAHRCGALLVDTLVALHETDPIAQGLADFGRVEGFMARQVRRWHLQYAASVEETDLVEERVVGLLTERAPSITRGGIVHGDYRLTNVMFSPDLRSIAAVVDWEMATLGDPLTDIGLLFTYHEISTYDDTVMPHYPPEQGFLTGGELVERYCRAREIDPRILDYYIAFGYFKLASICAGIHARYRQGLTVGPGFERFGPLVGLTMRAAEATIERS